MGSFLDSIDNAIGTDFGGNNPNGNANRVVHGEGLGSIRLPTAGSQEFNDAAITAVEAAAIAAGGYYLYSAYGAAGVGAGAADAGVGVGGGTGYLGVGASESLTPTGLLGADLGVAGGSTEAGIGYAGTYLGADTGGMGLASTGAGAAVSSTPWYDGLWAGTKDVGGSIFTGLTGLKTLGLLGNGGGPGASAPNQNPNIYVPGQKNPTSSVFLPGSNYSSSPGVAVPKGSNSTITAAGLSPILLIGIAGALYLAKKKRLI